MWDQVKQALQESVQRVIFKVVALLPGILAFVLAVVLFTVIGWLLALAVRRVLAAAKFDQRLEGWQIVNVSEWSSGNSPTLLASRLVLWVSVALGLLIGISAFSASTDSDASLYLVGLVPKAIAALVLLLVGNIIARFLARSVLISAVNMNLQYARLISLGVKWLILVLTAAMVLDHLAIGGRIVDLGFGILFGGIVLAMALAVGLGSRELVTRSLEREATKAAMEPEEQPFRHF